MGKYSHIILTFENSMGLYLQFIPTSGTKIGKHSHIIHNFKDDMGIIPIFILNSRNDMELYIHIIPIKTNVPIFFTTLVITWECSHKIFLSLGYKRRQNLFPRRNPFVECWKVTTSQIFPIKGNFCPSLFTIMRKNFPCISQMEISKSFLCPNSKSSVGFEWLSNRSCKDWCDINFRRKNHFCRESFVCAVKISFLPWSFHLGRKVFVCAVKLMFVPWEFMFVPGSFCLCRDTHGPPP